MAPGKVVICGVNTAKLPLLTNEEKNELFTYPLDENQNDDGLIMITSNLVKEYEKGSDAEKLRASAKSIVKSYNETLKAMGKTNDILDQYYAKMLKEAASLWQRVQVFSLSRSLSMLRQEAQRSTLR